MILPSLHHTFKILAIVAASTKLAAAQTICATTQRPSSNPQAIDLTGRGEFSINMNGTTDWARVHYRPDPYSGFQNWVFQTTSENGQLDMEVYNYSTDRVIACFKPPQSETCVWLDPITACSMEAPITGDWPSAIEEFSVYIA